MQEYLRPENLLASYTHYPLCKRRQLHSQLSPPGKSRNSRKTLQSRLLNHLQLLTQSHKLRILPLRQLAIFVAKIPLLNRIFLQIVHLPFVRTVGFVLLVILRQLITFLPNIDNRITPARIRRIGLPGLIVVVFLNVYFVYFIPFVRSFSESPAQRLDDYPPKRLFCGWFG